MTVPLGQSMMRLFHLTPWTSDDHDGYIKSDAKETDLAYLEIIGAESLAVAADSVNVTIDPNPSYESMSGGVKLEDNPSYNKIKLT